MILNRFKFSAGNKTDHSAQKKKTKTKISFDVNLRTKYKYWVSHNKT